MRQLKKKFKIKKSNKNKRRIKNRMFPILLSLLIISTTYATTQAYFNSKADFSKLFGSSEDSGNLKVTNGNVNLEFSNDEMAWITTSSKGITNDGKGTYVCSDLENANTFKYGPVNLTSASNLTTNVDLSVDFDLRAVQTSPLPSAGEEGSSTITSNNIVPGFEVIVGDIDNFSYGFEKNQNIGRNAFSDFQGAIQKSGSYYDVYNDYTTLFNRSFGSGTNASDGGGCPVATTYSRSYNGISIFPNSDYDAKGTDRRMVNTGFYNYLKNKNVITPNQRASIPNNNGVAFGDSNQNNNSSYCTFDYTKYPNKFYVNGANYYWMFFDNDGLTRVVYDGYTDRALKGFYGVWYQGTLDSYNDLSNAHNSYSDYTSYGVTYNNIYWGNWIGEEDNHIDGNTNWKYIQPVQELTFKYAKVPDKGEIKSLCIQIYIDDIQPKHQDRKDNSSFSYVSQNQYQVLISGNGNNYKEISTWSKIINNLSQSGPSGQMVTLNMSDLTDTEVNDVIDALKKGSGLNGNGLKIKIDDTEEKRDITDGIYKSRLGLGDNSYAVSGDSYAIDFAKMTVNGNIDATETKMKISGTVKDSTDKSVLEGVTVMTSNSAQTTTDSNGKYELNPIKESTQITFIKNGYETYTTTIDGNATEYNVDIEMKKLAVAVDPDKVNLTIRVEEYPTNNTFTNESGLRTTISDLNGGGDLTQGEISTTQKGNVVVKQYSKAIPSENKCLVTETTYENIDLLQLSATQAQCTVEVNPGSVYKVYYIVEMTSISGCYSYEFTSSIRAKSTQENNPGWNIIGSGNKYSSSYNIIGDEIVYQPDDSESGSGSGSDSGSGSGSGSTDKEIDSILKNNTPEVYFQNAKSWSTPKIRINNKNNVTVYNTTSGTQVSEATTWYKWTLDNKGQLPVGSQIVVTSNSASRSSGNLYYFNTNKVFICTE